MTEVDFTSDLWLFLSPWCEEEKLDDFRYTDAIALAWVALWNFCNVFRAKPLDALAKGRNETCTRAIRYNHGRAQLSATSLLGWSLD
jgi:hypothetical protein